MMKFIDMEVIVAIIAVIVVALVFFVGRDAEAATAGTSVTVTQSVTAEVACNPINCPEIPQEAPAIIQDVESPSLWNRIVDIFRFW